MINDGDEPATRKQLGAFMFLTWSMILGANAYTTTHLFPKVWLAGWGIVSMSIAISIHTDGYNRRLWEKL